MMTFAYCSTVIYFMCTLPAISENDLVVISKNGLKDEERTGGAQVGHHHVIPDLYAEFLYKQKWTLFQAKQLFLRVHTMSKVLPWVLLNKIVTLLAHLPKN